MEKDDLSKEFDPSQTNGFRTNLSKVFEEEDTGTEPINIVTEDSPNILLITGDEAEAAASLEEFDPEKLPVIDTTFSFEEEMQEEAEVDDTVLENISNQLASQVKLEYGEEEKTEKKRPVWLIPVISAVSCLLLLLIFLFGTAPGRKLLIKTSFGKFVVSHVGGIIFEEETDYQPSDSDDFEPTPEIEPSAVPEPSLTPEPTAPAVEEEAENESYHFLLLGMDETEGAAPMADLIILLTMDVTNQQIKMTTILRDLFVQIPETDADKIGAVYSKGGIRLLYDTLELNLGIRPDGYFLFTYDGFRNVINTFGGVTMTVTAREAEYLNRTNYISLPENRTLVAGMNQLNGDQALGYCRIRHVATAQNEYNDIGRTARCRRLIAALFEQSASKGIGELYLAVRQCLAQLTTDITGEECTAYLELFMGMKNIGLQEYRIPVDGSYETSIIRGSSTLVANMIQNQLLWKEFLYPDIPENEPESQPEPSSNN